ncbi:MAG TPA: NRDE family protein, partial [Burkholderiales bacterium]
QATADFWTEAPHVLAGRDLREGGTWMGVTRGGRFAAVTNYRDPRELKETRKSRGLLVKGYLAAVHRDADAYNGFNLMVGDLREAAYCSNREGGVRALGPGMYGLSNHLLDTPWPKVERSKAALFDMLSRDKPGLIEGLFRVLADGYRPEDAKLPDTGVGLEWERLLSSAFIKSPGYGTRSSTVYLVDGEGGAHFIERSFGPGGAALGAVEFEFRIEAE